MVHNFAAVFAVGAAHYLLALLFSLMITPRFFSLTLVLPSLFCNMVYQGGGGGGYHPLMNLKLTGPKYDCLVPWYRVGSPLSIDTKIMKIGQRMTSQ